MARVEIYFVTNRNYIAGNKRDVFGGRFNPDGVAALRFGKAVFEVEDQGPGFDPRMIPDPTEDENIEIPSGRGVMLMRAFMSQVDSARWLTPFGCRSGAGAMPVSR